MNTQDFYFDLPDELIARYPLPERSASRLLSLEHQGMHHRRFYNIEQLLKPGDLLVFNDTRVIPARFYGRRHTGGKVELLVERLLDERSFLAQLHASKSLRLGEKLLFQHDIQLEILGKQDRFYQVQCVDPDHSVLAIIEKIGEIPLPPYMKRSAEDIDKERYQTIYAKHQGSVAAPTAGLHFDAALLQNLRKKQVEMAYLTLHIGAGTFAPVRAEKLKDHLMHAEYLHLSQEVCEQIRQAKREGRRVIAVGTTSLRALETAAESGEIQAYQGDTRIFIYPGYTFHCVDALITNLHLPCSSLLMLVCAFAGQEKMMRAYQEAVREQYRFYSYGDAMWMERSAD